MKIDKDCCYCGRDLNLKPIKCAVVAVVVEIYKLEN